MGSGGIAVTSMRSSAPCGVVPRRVGNAARLLGRVRLLLRLGSSEGSVFGRLSLVPRNFLCDLGVLEFMLLMFIQKVHQCYHHVCMRYGYVIESFHGFTPTWLRFAPHLGVILSYVSGFSLLPNLSS